MFVGRKQQFSTFCFPNLLTDFQRFPLLWKPQRYSSFLSLKSALLKS